MKRTIIITTVGFALVLAGCTAATPETEQATRQAGAKTTETPSLYPDRPDRQSEDHEAQVGQSVELSGYTATVLRTERVNDEIMGEHLVAFVRIENRDDSAQPYTSADWRIQTPDGRVLDASFVGRDDELDFGDLVPGGTVEGSVPFEVPTSAYFLIYKPGLFDAARGIWRVEG